jgi:hypothetical protein
MSMMLIVCSECAADLKLVSEKYDDEAQVFVGDLVCPECGAAFVDQRRKGETRPDGLRKTAAARLQEEPIQMFTSENIQAFFKDAKLRIVRADDDEQKVAECRFVIEPFTYALAKELGPDVAGHFFQMGGAMRPEVTRLELTCPSGEHQVFIRRHAEVKRPNLAIRPVTVTAAKVERQEDEKAGKSWFRLTLALSFGIYDRPIRDFVIDWFGSGLVFTMQDTQRELIADEADVQQTAH